MTEYFQLNLQKMSLDLTESTTFFELVSEAAHLLMEDAIFIGGIILSVLQMVISFVANLAQFIYDVLSILNSLADNFSISLSLCIHFMWHLIIDVPVSISSYVISIFPNNYIFNLFSNVFHFGKFITRPFVDLVCVLNSLCMLIIDNFLQLYLSLVEVYQHGNFALILCLFTVCLVFGGTLVELALVSCRNMSSKFGYRFGYSVESRGNISLRNQSGSQQDQQKTCCVCLTEERSIVILPCTHFCLCSQCSVALTSQTSSSPLEPPQCPVCRSTIREFMPIISS